MDLFPAIPPEQRSWPRRFLNRLEVNRAVFYALALRGWQFVGGTVSVLLISLYFTQELQGYYYTLSGLIALQLFFELGMGAVIVAVASHEWAHLKLNERGAASGASEPLSRLASLAHFVAVWYSLVCLLFVVVVGAAGVVFFVRSGASSIPWMSPWLALVVLSGALLWLLPLAALLEGCEQVSVVNRFRLIEAVSANVVVWCAILAGAGLWALAAAAAARLVCQAYLVGVRYRSFFLGLWRTPPGPRLDWRKEVWPMQWRLAIGSIAAYFSFALFTPVIFSYHGDAAAGRIGMTWTLVTVLHSAAIAWVQVRAPQFGVLIARRDYAELDRVYNRVFRVSLVLLAIACGGFLAAILAVDYFHLWLADRLLPPMPTAMFLLAIWLNHIPASQNFYMRAHRREVVLARNVISSLGIGFLVWLLGSRYGADGAAGAYLAVTVLFTLPYQAYLYRKFQEEIAPDRAAGPVAQTVPK
jgi:O-antigen/teichoic acid export membrane protein